MKLVRKFLAKYKHWHKWSAYTDGLGHWGVVCSCGKNTDTTYIEKRAREIAWKSNVNSGNLKSNYIENGKVVDSSQSSLKF